MGRIPLTFLTIAVSGLAGTTSLASADTLVVTRTVHVFEAHLQDSACGNNTFCGAGKLTGFGRVKTRAAFGPPALLRPRAVSPWLERAGLHS
jgi:hypothetical protein